MKNTVLLIIAVVVIIAGVGGFFAGTKYQENKQPSKADFQTMRGQGQGIGNDQRPAGMEMVRGEIIDIDEDSLTVKLLDDSSKIIIISDNTQINKATEASFDDLQTGEQVMVSGKTNSDGSVSATQIQLNFEFRMGQPPTP
jgi:hypothetical protein